MRLAPDSLRGRLLLTGLLGTALAAAAVAWLLGLAFERSVLGNFERELLDDMLTLAGHVTSDAGGRARLRAEPADLRFHRVFSGHYWVVRQRDGTQVSRSLWDARLDVPAVEAGNAPAYFDLAGPLDQPLRAVSQSLRIARVEGPVQVLVAADSSAAHAQIARFRVQAGLAGALVGVLLLAAIGTQARIGLRPLARMATALRQLHSGEANRLPSEGLPSEVRPLADALNGVLLHNERMVERARAATADLAHGLKTPLSVLQVAAERGDPDLPQLVLQQAQRMHHGIERQLSSAAIGNPLQRTAVAPVAEALAAMLRRVHASRGIDVRVEVPGGLVFPGGQADLEDMLGNLLDNACKWAASTVLVRAAQAGDTLSVSVADDGPGIPPGLRTAATHRGTRLDQKAPGSGLGLSIVSSLAASHGGTLLLEVSALGGLEARLQLPGARHRA